MPVARRVRLSSALVCAGLVGVLGATVVHASTASPVMAGLGDSYASGLGSGDYGDSGDCRRSTHAYAVLDSQRIGASLIFVACSGATTNDVDADQLTALSASTTDVTPTVGGNDVGFVEVLGTCALSGHSGCSAAIDVARALIKSLLPGRLDALYGDIAAKAPGATVVVVGCPRLFNGQDCSVLTSFSRKEMSGLNGTADRIDAVIGRAAKTGRLHLRRPTLGVPRSRGLRRQGLVA